ncbi:MAG TPA: 6-bladed beta-propeller, partial [Prolixibacteraceae bacterium]|nr:6-bladed beta-propeller [Prolixibacteraceae bacterium]
MRIFVVFIIVALLIGCNGASDNYEKKHLQRSFFQWLGYSNKNEGLLPEYDKEKLIKLPDDINKKALVLNDLIDSLYYIKLGQADQVSIEAIDKIVFAGDKIIIIDKKKKKGLYLFSGNGAFLCKIGNLGKGPSEYLSASDVAIDRSSGNIVVLDQFGKKLLYYDTNGGFLKEKPIGFYVKDLSVLEDSNCVYYQLNGVNEKLKKMDDYCLLLTDDKQKVINCSFPYSYRAFCS